MTSRHKDYTGQKFDSLTAISFLRLDSRNRAIYLWECDCGKQLEHTVISIRSGEVRSCGCKRKRQNHTGKTYNHLTGVSYVRSEQGKGAIWLWQCDCGKTAEKPASGVCKGSIQSCGHLQNARKDYTGQKFNMLTAIKFVRMNGSHQVWLVRCDCGKEKDLAISVVASGSTKSCGCLVIKRDIDYTGQKFYSLTAIKFIKHEHNKQVWLMRCDCGVEKEISIGHAICGNTKTCGGKIHKPRTDYTGQKHGSLTAIRFVRMTKHYSQIWELICDCGKLTECPISAVLNGRIKTCGCSSVNKNTGIMALAYSVFSANYKDGDLVFDEWYELSQQNCHYCGVEPSNIKRIKNREYVFTYQGVDRVISKNADGSRALHDKSNCVPCCKKCNLAKSDMSQEDFIIHIERIYNHQCHKDKT